MHKSSASPHLIPLFVVLLLTTLTFSAQAVTTLVSPSIYSVTERVTFSLANNGASDFLFSWTDPSGSPANSFTNIADPTLKLSIGQTYTFQRTSTSHPFVIMNNTISSFISGTDGSFSRTTSDFNTITSATIFTANPGTPGAAANWTPTIAGDYFYTCSVGSHGGMTGKISVIPEPSSLSLLLLSLGALSIRRRRH
jgi:plastocyanin